MDQKRKHAGKFALELMEIIQVRNLVAFYLNKQIKQLWVQPYDALYYTGVTRGVQIPKRNLLLCLQKEDFVYLSNKEIYAITIFLTSIIDFFLLYK